MQALKYFEGAVLKITLGIIGAVANPCYYCLHLRLGDSLQPPVLGHPRARTCVMKKHAVYYSDRHPSQSPEPLQY